MFCREIVAWYTKRNTQIVNQEKIIQLLKEQNKLLDEYKRMNTRRYDNMYKNINYKDTVGNIILQNDKLVYCTDKNSVNTKTEEIEILYDDIDKVKLLEDIKKPNMQTVEIISKDKKFHFEFNFVNEYEKFINEIQLIFGE